MFDRIKEMLVSELGIDATEVTPEAKLKGNLGISSVEFVDIAGLVKGASRRRGSYARSV